MAMDGIQATRTAKRGMEMSIASWVFEAKLFVSSSMHSHGSGCRDVPGWSCQRAAESGNGFSSL